LAGNHCDRSLAVSLAAAMFCNRHGVKPGSGPRGAWRKRLSRVIIRLPRDSANKRGSTKHLLPVYLFMYWKLTLLRLLRQCWGIIIFVVRSLGIGPTRVRHTYTPRCWQG